MLRIYTDLHLARIYHVDVFQNVTHKILARHTGIVFLNIFKYNT